MAKLASRSAGVSEGKAVVKPVLRALRDAFDKARVATARHLRPVRPTAHPKSIRFESLEPRVLLSGDVAPAQTVTGSIDVPGESDQYGLNLTENARIVFDSLTNNDQFN